MPANYARTEVRLSRETKAKLVRLRDAAREKTGRGVTLGEVVSGIVDLFLEKSGPGVSGSDTACNQLVE